MDLASTTCSKVDPRCWRVSCRRHLCVEGDVRSNAAPSRQALPFPSTTRWLRGRLVATVTHAPGGAWVALPDRLGVHDTTAIQAAARSLEAEGFLEIDDGRVRVRE